MIGPIRFVLQPILLPYARTIKKLALQWNTFDLMLIKLIRKTKKKTNKSFKKMKREQVPKRRRKMNKLIGLERIVNIFRGLRGSSSIIFRTERLLKNSKVPGHSLIETNALNLQSITPTRYSSTINPVPI